MDCSPPGSSVHGISQTRILEQLPFPTPGDLPNPGIEPFFTGRQILYHCGTWEATPNIKHLWYDLYKEEQNYLLSKSLFWILNIYFIQFKNISLLSSTRGVGWEGASRGRDYIYGWFTLLYSRNQYNTVKQLSSSGVGGNYPFECQPWLPIRSPVKCGHITDNWSSSYRRTNAADLRWSLGNL